MSGDDLDRVVLAHNTPEARERAANVPTKLHSATFESFPGDAAARERVRAWASSPRCLGLVLQGPAGVGKTGLAASALAHLARLGVGQAALWNLVTEPHYRAEVEDGHLRRRPAPAWFERWSDLRDRLRRSWRGRDESRGSEELLLDELRERCAVLVVDDLDVDAVSDWKESVLLRLIEMPELGRRLILTINAPRADFAKRFGERCTDRLADFSVFEWVTLRGRSLR